MNTTRIKVLVFALLLVLVAAVGTILMTQRDDTVNPVAKITLDGTVVKEIDLSKVDEAYSFTLTGIDGLENTILVEPGRIRVTDATCPDHICVEQGFISTSTVPIVCLPNHLIIQIQGGGDDLDAATG